MAATQTRGLMREPSAQGSAHTPRWLRSRAGEGAGIEDMAQGDAHDHPPNCLLKEAPAMGDAKPPTSKVTLEVVTYKNQLFSVKEKG